MSDSDSPAATAGFAEVAEAAAPCPGLAATTAAGFAPLRLVLEPDGPALEVKDPDVVLGRHSEANVRLPLADVSRRHCRLFVRAGRWHVQDLRSLNGIFVNGQAVEKAALHDGDRLRIGGFSFRVEMPDAAPRSGRLLRRLFGEHNSRSA